MNERRRRKPTSPGEILKEEFLVPLGMTQNDWPTISVAMSKSLIGL